MKEQIKNLQSLLAKLEAQHDEADRLDCEDWGSQEWHEALTLEENTITEITAHAFKLFLSYHEEDPSFNRLGFLISQLD